MRVTSTEGAGSSSCGSGPWRARRSALVTLSENDRVVVAGAVPAAIARAEAELADGRRVAFDTVAGPGYRGRYAGRLRFFLAPVPLTDSRDEEAGGLVAVRFFDAAGALQGIAAGRREGRQVGRTRRLLRQRARGASITVTAVVQRRLASTPLSLDRFETLTPPAARQRARARRARAHAARGGRNPAPLCRGRRPARRGDPVRERGRERGGLRP